MGWWGTQEIEKREIERGEGGGGAEREIEMEVETLYFQPFLISIGT